jgi:DNA topoisomerase-1
MGAWIATISKLAKDADSFVSACDFDTEGSLIAYMILKHACDGADARAMRMKFSTLTVTDLVAAYEKMTSTLDFNVINAGKVRHELDWIFGINVSRALMDALSRSSGKFDVLSAGRVQSPTLNILYKRELGINLHVPDPFWVIGAEADIGGSKFPAEYRLKQILSQEKARQAVARCNGKEGVIEKVDVREATIPPPFPFDLGTLQREAYKIFRFSPSTTQKLAERLYLDALISYPRTSSQKLPRTLGLRGILEKLAKSTSYSGLASEILASGRPLSPREGTKSDPAHPAIHPTGKSPEGRLGRDEYRLFDLIVKRFLATFGDYSSRKLTAITIMCGKEDLFVVKGESITSEGWIRAYSPYAVIRGSRMPDARAGETVMMSRVWVEDRFTAPLPRFNPSSILYIMEKNNLGTKATRADILDTLYRRGYIESGRIEVTDLGMSVLSILRKFFPELTKVDMTKKLGNDMDGIELGTKEPKEVIGEAVEDLKPIFEKIIEDYDEIGEELLKVMNFLKERKATLGRCPSCADGSLTVVYSRRTGKRFVGCSNYSNGCRFSLPLPQRGKLKATKETCNVCGLPIVEIRGYGYRVWRLCINDKCPSKEGKLLPDLQKAK